MHLILRCEVAAQRSGIVGSQTFPEKCAVLRAVLGPKKLCVVALAAIFFLTSVGASAQTPIDAPADVPNRNVLTITMHADGTTEIDGASVLNDDAFLMLASGAHTKNPTSARSSSLMPRCCMAV